MKLLSVAIPSYNSQDYLMHAVESLLPGGEEVEILIVDDGSTDDTPRIADEYAQKYPSIVRAIHKENGGHGDAVMAGLQHAEGLYFKVVDSDDWVDAKAYPKVLAALRAYTQPSDQVDLFISNFIYDKAEARHKHIVSYYNALPKDRRIGWEDVKHFRAGQYILMHAAIYRVQLLRECHLILPKHTFYVDNLYVYTPLPYVKSLYYIDEDFYHYFIGREDQSVQEQTMIRRIDQQLLVNRLMMDSVDLTQVENKAQRDYMLSYLEIITTVSSVLLIKSGTLENHRKLQALWVYLKQKNEAVYALLRFRPMGIACNIPGQFGRWVVTLCYNISRRYFGFN